MAFLIEMPIFKIIVATVHNKRLCFTICLGHLGWQKIFLDPGR